LRKWNFESGEVISSRGTNQTRSCWDRRRPRLPTSNLTNRGYLSLLIK